MQNQREDDQDCGATNKECKNDSENESTKEEEEKLCNAEAERSSPEEESEEESEEDVQSIETGVPIESKICSGEEELSDEEEEEVVNEEENEEEEEFLDELPNHEEDEFADEEISDEEEEEFLDEELSNHEEDEFADEEISDEEEEEFLDEGLLNHEEDEFADDEISDEEEDAFTDETESFGSQEGETDEEFQPRDNEEMKKIVHAGPNPPPPLPPDFKNCIQEKSKGQGMSIADEILVIQKQLSEVETDQQRDRFFIPSGVIKNELFNDDELKELDLNNFISVTMIDPLIESGSIKLQRKIMKENKGGGEPSRMYILHEDWNRIVTAKNLEEGDIVQLWAVRVGGNFCFVLVKLPRGGGEDNSDSNSNFASGSDAHESEAESETTSLSSTEENEDG